MILVVGDRMVDEYQFGEVERVSPEAPVPVLRHVRTEVREGAAANVAANVRAMGGECELVSATGCAPVRKVRSIARNQQILRTDFDFPQRPIETIEPWRAEVVIFSDYAKGALEHVERLICEARDKGMKILVDPKGYDYFKYRGADLLKPNWDEMRAMVGVWRTEDELSYHAHRVMAHAGIGAILLTRAGEGMTLYDASGDHHIPAAALEVFDVTGAGDTAIAAFAVALERGCDFLSAAQYANKAAGIAVARFGTAVVGEAEVFGTEKKALAA